MAAGQRPARRTIRGGSRNGAFVAKDARSRVVAAALRRQLHGNLQSPAGVLARRQAGREPLMSGLDVVVYSDVLLYREGVRSLLSRTDDLSVVGVAETPLRAVELTLAKEPAVALLDTASHDCSVLARELLRVRPTLGLIALSIGCGEEEVLRCAEHGFLGFIPRDGSLEDLLCTVRGVACGELVCSPRVAAGIARRLAGIGAERRMPNPCDELSRRELEVLKLIERGLGNKQIAQQLHISVATVKNHVHSVLRKLPARSRNEAAEVLRQSWQAVSHLTSA